MAQLSEMNLDEWMLIISTIMALPMMMVLLVIVFLGKFPKSEDERYLAMMGSEPDYWSTSPADERAATPAAGEAAKEMKQDER